MDNNNIETDESAENINELDLLNDRFLRKCAEFENYKRRVQKDKEELVLNTKNKILSAILDMDNDVSLALKSMDKVDEGVLLIVHKLDTFLKSQGVETIQTENYDDELHEVISVVPTGKDEVIQVVSKGYMLNGKLLRHPKIIIGK